MAGSGCVVAGAGAPKEAKVLGGEKALQVPSSSRQSVGRGPMVFVDFPLVFPSSIAFPPEVTVTAPEKGAPREIAQTATNRGALARVESRSVRSDVERGVVAMTGAPDAP